MRPVSQIQLAKEKEYKLEARQNAYLKAWTFTHLICFALTLALSHTRDRFHSAAD